MPTCFVSTDPLACFLSQSVRCALRPRHKGPDSMTAYDGNCARVVPRLLLLKRTRHDSTVLLGQESNTLLKY